MSKGVIKDPASLNITVAPIGNVKQLVAVEALVKPGASGAPVVNEDFEVLGFIVAGADKLLPSYMLPASFWAGALENQKKRAPRAAARGQKKERGIPKGKGSKRR
jgi:hypothetical protein